MKGAKIIIKKVKKRGHGGGHGGSWKVAYADFVTAMMAFFLLLWLLSMVAPEKRARIANYFKFFALFEESGTSMMESSVDLAGETSGDAPKVPDDWGKRDVEMKEAQGPARSNGATQNDIQAQDMQTMQQQIQQMAEQAGMTKEDLMEQLKREIEKKLAELKDQIIIDVFEGGVRIQLVDKDKKPMFPLASAVPTADARRILKVISDNVKTLENKIAIEGHTDSLTYMSSKYTNWELSTERASAARKELESNGMSPDRLTRVAGYAATDPLIPENPADPRNRRISIMLMFPRKGAPVSDSLHPAKSGPSSGYSSQDTIPMRSKLGNVTEIKPTVPSKPEPKTQPKAELNTPSAR